jgi:hypothetical protein
MTPRFVVVGHPNKGKSSIVATLAESDDVMISPIPGTTTKARRFPFSIDGEVLYELIDTPGFQRPRETLAWLEEHDPAADKRADTVAAFVAAHEADPRFGDECELLTPLLDSAGLLYVVDGSKPYGPEYEAEMQVLRWTGRPRMALINLIGDADFVDDWRRALDQFFGIVRVFDAARADFEKRVALLKAFGELSEDWAAPLARALDALATERAHRRRQCAAEIADLLIDVTSQRLRKRFSPVADSDKERAALTRKLLDRIRRREDTARNQIQAFYRHADLQRDTSDSPLGADLFSTEAWEVFGLSSTQLAAAGAVSGAVAGGSVDAILGGASLLLGAGVGALLGGATVFFGSDQLAKTKVLGLPLGGKEMVVGPVKDPNFPWVVLGRALLHQQVVSERNHARREALILEAEAEQRVTEALPTELRRNLSKIIARTRDGDGLDRHEREKLERYIEPLLAD